MATKKKKKWFFIALIVAAAAAVLKFGQNKWIQSKRFLVVGQRNDLRLWFGTVTLEGKPGLTGKLTDRGIVWSDGGVWEYDK